MENTDVPKNYTGIVNFYLTSRGFWAEAGKISNNPMGSVLVFIVQKGIIEAKYVEKYDQDGILIYSIHYN